MLNLKDFNLILGLDIGGANTKAALIKFKDTSLNESYSFIKYFPFWEQNLDSIPQMFEEIIEDLILAKNYSLKDIDEIAITITAELSDAFQTKKEGLLTILKSLEKVFDKHKLKMISNKARFLSFETAYSNPLEIAAANWASTALYLGKYIPNCLLIDAGSTTVDMIPIINSTPATIGKNDITRLLNHELIYTGGLRATIPSITHFIPYKGNRVRISFEKFALISDVHLILGNISEDQYINDTADNRSKSLDDCYARLARILCMDTETISKSELDSIADYIYKKQLDIILEEFEIFYKNIITRYPIFKKDPIIVLTGLSSEFLIRPCLEKMGLVNIKKYEQITHIPDYISSSAFAVAGALYFHN